MGDLGTSPAIERAVLIDDRRIEVWWSDFMRGAGDDAAFEVELDGRVLPLVHWTPALPWSYGCLYQKETQRTTLALAEPVDPARAGDMTVRVASSAVRSLFDEPCDTVRRVPLAYAPYYTQVRTCASGVIVKAGATVSPLALDITCATVDLMLERLPDVARTLVGAGAEVAIFGLREMWADIPEHRMGYLVNTRHFGGYGAEPDNPITSVSEANAIRLRCGRYATAYPNENLLVHEYGHAVHLVGINFLEDRTLAGRCRDAYAHAVNGGLWPHTYASSNYEEYFATLTQIWFNVMQEGVNGAWDGIRGPVNTRAELEAYDPVGFALMADLYPAASLPAPWDACKDSYDAAGALRPGEALDLPTDFDWSRTV